MPKSTIVMLLVMLCTTPLAIAGGGHGDKGVCCAQCGQKICCPEVDEKDVTKSCWNTECKEVCVPPIRLPWDRCCTLACGGIVRTINVLKETEYKCKEKTYSWKPVCASCQARHHGQHGSSCSACDAFAHNTRSAASAVSANPVQETREVELVSLATSDDDRSLDAGSAGGQADSRSVAREATPPGKSRTWLPWLHKSR
jgi:hypothetical protein